MADVLRWIDRPADGVGEACEILEIAGASAAFDQLQAVAGLDERNRGTTFMSAAHLLEAYRYPSVQATDRQEISPSGLLDGRANTLYIVATDDEQRLLAPLVIAMIGELLAHRDRSDRSAQAPDRCLWLLLDETANIAPLEDLPRHLAGKRGSNVRFVTVWQDHAQLRRAYGASDGTVLSNSAVKVYLGPITDDLTRRYLDGVLGEERVETITRQARGGQSVGHAWRPRATAQAQQQLGPGRALLLHGHLLAALIDTQPWFHRRAIARRRRRVLLRRMPDERPVKQESFCNQDTLDDVSGRRPIRRSDAP
jgi:type IV secretory pathway TraG/TraD family ATPase VirD4